jgi:hypothetical protein
LCSKQPAIAPCCSQTFRQATKWQVLAETGTAALECTTSISRRSVMVIANGSRRPKADYRRCGRDTSAPSNQSRASGLRSAARQANTNEPARNSLRTPYVPVAVHPLPIGNHESRINIDHAGSRCSRLVVQPKLHACCCTPHVRGSPARRPHGAFTQHHERLFRLIQHQVAMGQPSQQNGRVKRIQESGAQQRLKPIFGEAGDAEHVAMMTIGEVGIEFLRALVGRQGLVALTLS